MKREGRVGESGPTQQVRMAKSQTNEPSPGAKNNQGNMNKTKIIRGPDGVQHMPQYPTAKLVLDEEAEERVRRLGPGARRVDVQSFGDQAVRRPATHVLDLG